MDPDRVWIDLAPDERVGAQADMRTSSLLGRGRLRLLATDRRIVARRPGTLLGLISAGYTKVTFPVHSVAAIAVGVRVRALPAVVGAFFLAVGAALLAFGVWGSSSGSQLPALSLGGFGAVLGAILIASARVAEVSITNCAGDRIRLPIALRDRQSAAAFADRAATVVADAGRPAPRGAAPGAGGPSD